MNGLSLNNRIGILLLWLLPLGGYAQTALLMHEYNDRALKVLLTEVLKDKKLQGDCQCSKKLHKNYPLVVQDTIYKPAMMKQEFGLFLMNLQQPPFSPRNASEVVAGLSLDDLQLANIADKIDPLPSSKQINPSSLPKRYYQVTRLTPLYKHPMVFAFYILEEIREDKSCTPIYVTVVLNHGQLLEAKTVTLCD